jgi:hypothetical protein
VARLHFVETSTATPEQLLAGLTDFGPSRQELFENSSDDHLKVHRRGDDHADVTEGAAGVWERLHYDWSNPRRIVMTTTDSNLWGGESGHVYTLSPQPDGTTVLDAVVVREGKNLRGKLVALLLGSVGKGGLEKALRNTIRVIETRNNLPGS